MGDIYETIDGYEAACKEAGVVPLAYVMACLNFEREECITYVKLMACIFKLNG